MSNSLVHIYQGEKAQQRQRVECTVEKSCVLFAPLVSSKCPCLLVLEVCDICLALVGAEAALWSLVIPTLADLELSLAFGLQLVESIRHSEDLHSTNCGQHMGIVMGRGTESAILMLTREDKVDDILARESIGMTEQMKRRQAPV